jgi:hypothetical protein
MAEDGDQWWTMVLAVLKSRVLLSENEFSVSIRKSVSVKGSVSSLFRIECSWYLVATPRCELVRSEHWFTTHAFTNAMNNFMRDIILH